jgi:FAD/FMN-containing dehydrogenase
VAVARRCGVRDLAQRGGAYSEDIAVPLDRLRDVARETLEIGVRHDVPALSFGHAGDGNIHSTFLFSPENLTRSSARTTRSRAVRAALRSAGRSPASTASAG